MGWLKDKEGMVSLFERWKGFISEEIMAGHG